jgi:hypothetical protein
VILSAANAGAEAIGTTTQPTSPALCVALSQYVALGQVFINGMDPAQDLAEAPRLAPLLRVIGVEGPPSLRSFWKIGQNRYELGEHLLRVAGLTDAQLATIAKYNPEYPNSDSATAIIGSAAPTPAEWPNVNAALEEWPLISARFTEPVLHGSKLAALRSEVRQCSLTQS